jgi:asparagine synthase (glutamine-hydrolysing)
MLRTLVHRGPDGSGVYLDTEAALGHVRLSIIDLGTGAQPMTNEDETVWIVFNGEIYNYRQLRERLMARGHVFRTHSDTEVIVHLYEEYGPACVRELQGMFALAIWDRNKRRLFAARDRVGIKPFYFSETPRGFVFGSELKALLTQPSVCREVSLPAVRTFLDFGYLPGEATLFRSIRKLLPGHCLTVEAGVTTVSQYWDLHFSVPASTGSFEDACDELHTLLGEAVRDHMIADVPVGVLLSGGVDSSAVLSFAAEAAGRRVQTFTVGFGGGGVVDERPYARLMAQRIGAEHHETSVVAEDFWQFLPTYVRHMEEPVCEPPAVALHFVTRLARQHGLKVLLSGEGGDEAFAGYSTYPNMVMLKRWEAAMGPLAGVAGRATAGIGRLFGSDRLMRYGTAMGRPLACHYFSRAAGPGGFFFREAERFFDPQFLRATAAVSPADHIRRELAAVAGQPLVNQMLYIDSKTWLPDDLLVKADKITMANSVELRVPLLDHRLLEFAARLPVDFKMRGRETKRILKAATAARVPSEIRNRPKAGFPVPYASWLRREFKGPVREILLSSEACGRGYGIRSEVARLLAANEATGRFAKEVFSLLVLELWHREFDGIPATAIASGPAISDQPPALP